MSKKSRRRTGCGIRVFLDNTALSRLESKSSKLADALQDEHADDSIIVPAVVYAEWLVGQTDSYIVSRVRDFVDVMPSANEPVAVRAGNALRALYGDRCGKCGMRFRPSVVDSLLAGLADLDTDVIYTCDTDDLTKLCAAMSLKATVRFAE